MRKRLLICGLTAILLATLGGASWADDDDYDASQLVPVFDPGNMPLEQALRASEQTGQPVSAKYEVHRGLVELTVRVVRGGSFIEVVFDHRSGSIAKTRSIADSEDLADEQEHALAMASAKLPLVAAVEKAMAANAGYKAVRVVPFLAAGIAPVAMVTLMRGRDVKEVSEKLD